MYVKNCPICGRQPVIHEGCLRKNGNRFYMIGCPNYCWVLKPQRREDMWRKVSWLCFEGTHDFNYLYKKWNEALVNG